jgi:urease accessory protein
MITTRRTMLLAATGVATLAATQAAFGHPGHDHGEAGGFIGGLMHPVLGLDHILAMAASGLLAVRAAHRNDDRRALWLVPASFAVLMLAGGLLALVGMPLPIAEGGIALSVIVLGVLVAALPKVPTWAGAVIVGLFAICHGYAHVVEAVGAIAPYMLGFTLSTLALHATAIAVGLTLARSASAAPIRVAGGAIAATFVVVLVLGL